ncbi:hypothetical protein CBP31_07580 [Oceanisphaera profunda]|uniref:LuxQ periplasmic domain-containing protein n=1 Tax=Oceanisphaera profunda TaxID=1416627 RepID=A0A1Y0D4P7_9GAMM|nr:hypothetical protein CBP31_07580 [Oceanisphaera profunda]
MLSVTQTNRRRQQTLLKLALHFLLPLLFLLAGSLLLLAWQSTTRIVNDSINYQMQEAQDRAQSRLDSYLTGLNTLLTSTAESPALANILLKGDRPAAKKILQNTLSHSYGEYLDLLLLTRQDQYWTNLNSPLYLLGNNLNSLIVDTPYFNKWSSVEIIPEPIALFSIIQRYPILSADSGLIAGSLFGGLILNDNLTLISLLGQGSTNKSLQLLIDDQPVGPAFAAGKIEQTIFEQAIASNLSQGEIADHYFSRQPLLINGEASKLQLLLIADKSMSEQLAHAYFYHLLLALVLILLFITTYFFLTIKYVQLNK